MKTKFVCLLTVAALAFNACKKQEKTEGAIAPNTALDTNATVAVNPRDAQVAEAKKTPTEITFTKTKHNFGKIKQGDVVSHGFSFTNTGKNDLLITTALGSCGCTVPEFPKEPIPPGKTGYMKVTFNSKGKTGPQHKTVTVYGNIPDGATVLNIEADVLTEENKK